MTEHVVKLGIGAKAWIEQDGPEQTLVLSDGVTEVRFRIPPAREGEEFPYLAVRGLAHRIEHQADEVRRNTEGATWQHGPLNGPAPRR